MNYLIFADKAIEPSLSASWSMKCAAKLLHAWVWATPLPKAGLKSSGCAMACPYSAPQYNASKGHMTKCDGCNERVAVGRQPICVTPCPLRALDFGPIDELRERYGTLADVAPLPSALPSYKPLSVFTGLPPYLPGISPSRL